MRGLINSIGEMTKDKQFCAIGSVKSNIGHAESAAGIAGVTKILLQMKYGQLVPSIHSEVINSKIDFESTPFYLERTLEDWKPKNCPRRAGISSFGAGGANAHILFEEYRQNRKTVERTEKEVLIVLSAKSREQIKEYAAELAQSISYQRKIGIEYDLRDIAFTLQVGREDMAYRMAMTSDNVDDLLRKLEAYGGSEQSLEGIYENKVNRSDKQKLENQELRQNAQQALLRKDWAQVAENWVRGMEMDWMSLYRDDMPYHVSLAGYPFKRERYWIPEGENKVRELGLLHPLVHRNLSTIYGVKYQTDLNRNLPFYMNEKYIQNNGQSVLLGILLQTAIFASENQVTEISEIEITDDPELFKDVTVNVEISAEEDRFEERLLGEKSGREYAQCAMRMQEIKLVQASMLQEEVRQAQQELQDVQPWEEGVEIRTFRSDENMLLKVCSGFENTGKFHNLPMLFDFMGYMLSDERGAAFEIKKIQIFRDLEGVEYILKKPAKDGTSTFYCFDRELDPVFTAIGCDLRADAFSGDLLDIIKQVENGDIDVAYAEKLINGMI